jgi:hypothetical protein
MVILPVGVGYPDPGQVGYTEDDQLIVGFPAPAVHPQAVRTPQLPITLLQELLQAPPVMVTAVFRVAEHVTAKLTVTSAVGYVPVIPTIPFSNPTLPLKLGVTVTLLLESPVLVTLGVPIM